MRARMKGLPTFHSLSSENPMKYLIKIPLISRHSGEIEEQEAFFALLELDPRQQQ